VSNIVKEKPVATVGGAGVVVMAVLAYLVAHGVISAELAQQWGPLAAIVIPIIFGAIIHALVSPFEKVKHWAEASGLLTDADIARIGEAVAPKAPSLTAAPVEPAGDGMAAGAPETPAAPNPA
jgi:uncharacterized membrane protein YhdT